MARWITTFFAIILGIFSWWVWQNVDNEQISFRQPDPHEPDYYIESMVRTTTGISGEVKNILRAELVEHFPDDDSTELASPHLEIYNGRIEPWHVVAERGWVSSGNDVVLLHGEVEIWRNGDQGRRVYQLNTSELRVLPKEQYAETDDPATLIAPSTVTHAVGMRANFAHDRLELLQQVKSVHEVKPQT